MTKKVVNTGVSTGIVRLRPINSRAVWGCRDLGQAEKSLIAINDNEFALAVGSGLLHLDNTSVHSRKAKLVTTTYPDVEKVLLMAQSLDSQLLATSVQWKNQPQSEINIVIFQTKSKMEGPNRPRLLKHTGSGWIPVDDQLTVTAMDFSFDNLYLAVATNMASVGTLIFDQAKGNLIQTITSDIIPRTLSFHPTDNSKIIATGSNSFIKLWRFSVKSVHVAPVTGLRRGSHTYSTHAWIQPYTDSTVVVGSDSGFISVIQNCEQRAPALQVFGSATDKEFDTSSCGIAHILVRGDNVLVGSPKNQIVLFEVRRVVMNKAGQGLTATLFPLAYYRIQDLQRLIGLDFAQKNSVTSYTLIAMSESNVSFLDMITDHDLSGGNENQNNKKMAEGEFDDLWTNVHSESALFNYHHASIQSMSICSSARVFMTSSYLDATVRMWDFDQPSTFKSAWMIEHFAERPEENPFYSCLHPSGLKIATACESEVREYAVGDSQMDMIRRFGVRTPFSSHTGQPVVISQPASLLKYSHGGQLLAVVTGKIVQIFHMTHNDLSSATNRLAPCRVMTLCDHVATVTDIAFLRDDTRFITVSSDGCVYSWTLGGLGREKEYIQKGIAATKVAVSTHHADKCMIAVVFEASGTDLGHTLAAEVVRKRRQTAALRGDGNSRMSFMESETSTINHSRSIDRQSSFKLPNGSFIDSNAESVAAAPAANASSANASAKNYFVAVWENEISANPRIVYSDVPIKAVSMGRLPGPDSIDICALGLADGRIIVSTLPLPIISVSLSPVTVSVTTTFARPPLFGQNTMARIQTVATAMNASATNTHHNKRRKPPQIAALTEAIAESSANPSRPGSPVGLSVDGGHRVTISAPVSSSDALGATSSQEPTGNVCFSPGASDLNNRKDGESDSSKSSPTTLDMLNEANCKILRLFVGPVLHVHFSQEGEYIFAAGEDGTVHAISTTKPLGEDGFGYSASTTSLASGKTEEGEAMVSLAVAIPQYLMIERTKMQTFRSKLSELEFAVEQEKKDNELYIAKLLEGKEKQMQEMETKLLRDIQKRDNNILSGRKEYLNMKKAMEEDIRVLKKRGEDALSALELMYEKKLAEEAVYLDKIKQAYDEYVVHSRMDLESVQRTMQGRIQLIEQDKQRSLADAEKQKVTILQYYEYIRERHDEVLQSLEERQADERITLRTQLTETGTRLQQSQSQNMASEVQASRTIQKLKMDIENKEMEVLRASSDIGWANERIQKLETALEKAVAELKARSDLVEKWETKTVEQGRKIDDLEKIRKALTTQLNLVQGELDPKQKELIKATDRMQEMNREYEIALHAITEKEKLLGQRGDNLAALQKQVRDLRKTTAQRESALRRAAISLDEFVYAMNDSRFAPFPKNEMGQYIFKGAKGTTTNSSNNNNSNSNNNTQATSGKGTADGNDGTTAEEAGKRQHKQSTTLTPKPQQDGIVGSLDLDPAARNKLKKLVDILKPHLSDGVVDKDLDEEIDAVHEEQERHLTILHRNFHNLQSSLESTHAAAANKVANHLTDNQTLLKEVNNLRMEVKSLSLENHRLTAQMDYQATRHAAELHNMQSLVLNSETDERYTTSMPAKTKNKPSMQPTSSYPVSVPSTLPRIYTPSGVQAKPSLSDSLDSFPESPPPASSKPVVPNKRTNNSGSHVYMPSVDELLATHSRMPRSQSDVNQFRKGQALGNALSQSAPVLPLTANASTASLSAADKKIAAIIELNFDEIKKGNTSKS